MDLVTVCDFKESC